MSFGQNLQFLRKLRNGMTQEELAEKMQVSRQTISKWELDTAFPEMEKAMELCQMFSCSLDQLFREDMKGCSGAYSHFRTEEVPAFRYIRYAVISLEPEGDAISHVKGWAEKCGVRKPDVIGWDFPFVSQEQVNVFHMHGYAAAWILPEEIKLPGGDHVEVVEQGSQKYAAVTIREPFQAPFSVIPNAYKALYSYIQINGFQHLSSKGILSCYEREYTADGVQYMDVYMAVQS